MWAARHERQQNSSGSTVARPAAEPQDHRRWPDRRAAGRARGPPERDPASAPMIRCTGVGQSSRRTPLAAGGRSRRSVHRPAMCGWQDRRPSAWLCRPADAPVAAPPRSLLLQLSSGSAGPADRDYPPAARNRADPRASHRPGSPCRLPRNALISPETISPIRELRQPHAMPRLPDRGRCAEMRARVPR